MKLGVLFGVGCVLLGMTPECFSAEPGQPLEIGSRRELFIDRYLIESLDGTQLVLAEPCDRGPVLAFDKPWEGLFSGYVTVIRDGDRLKLYYRGHAEDAADGSPSEVTCYAESSDGIHWTKPALGLFTVKGTRENNVVLADAAPVTHNFCPFLDTNPNAASDERFKAVGGTSRSGLIGYASADGLHWRTLQDEPVFRDEGWVFDSQNVPFWSESEGCYVLYYRRAAGGRRAIARTTSADFRTWTEPVQMTYSDTGDDVPSHELYTNQTQPSPCPAHLRQHRRPVHEGSAGHHRRRSHGDRRPSEVFRRHFRRRPDVLSRRQPLRPHFPGRVPASGDRSEELGLAHELPRAQRRTDRRT